MAYLVQRNFKNWFYDFQISRCEYVSDVSDINEVISGNDDFEYWIEDIAFSHNGETVVVEDLYFMKVYPLEEGKPIKGHGVYWYNDQWRTKQEIIDIVKNQQDK